MPRTTRRTALPRPGTGIQAFARTTKPTILPQDTKNSTLPVSPSKKRKLNEIENVESATGSLGCVEEGKGEEGGVEEAATPSKTLRIGDLSVNSPRSGHYARTTSTPSTRREVKDVVVEEPKTPSKRASTRKTPQKKTPKSTYVERPQGFNDMLNMHIAFGKALTIHLAHNGITTPADLREFLPSIERLWKKRKVVLKDLQRLVWIWEQGTPSTGGLTYRLANYGLGRVCLERSERGERLDENEMQERFEETLELLWEKAESEAEKVSWADFVETLGLSPVIESLTPFTAFRKGQQRLQDLKGGVIRMKMEKMRADSGDDGAVPVREATNSRRQGLWDRIKNKELCQSKLPPPPSKDMLLRRAAAERVEEVVGVVACLRPVGYVGTGIKALLAAQRKPFQMQTIVQHVRDSMRTPISPQEVEICLELLAQEDVAGQWVTIVPFNGIRSVVLKSSADVSPKEIGAKVAQMKIGWDESAFKLDTSV